MDTSELKTYVQKYCEEQVELTDKQVIEAFQKRFDEKKTRRLIRPVCIPFVSTGRQYVRKVISPSQIIEDKDFDFYHHSPEDIVGYSLSIRKRPEIILRDMDDLRVDEFPWIQDNNIYMVSSNGHHRSFVFSTLGLEYVSVEIQEHYGNLWRYYIGGGINEIKTGHFILGTFLRLGLISEFDQDNCGEYEYHIKGPHNLAGWILPRLEESMTPLQALNESAERLNYIDRIYGELDLKSLRYIRSSKWRHLLSSWPVRNIISI